MIKHDLADLFRQNSIHKKFVINYDGGTITNSDLLMEEFSLEESICSEEELRFGSCEASVIKFPISNVFTSLNGKVLDVSVVLGHNDDKPLKIGKYKVASDIPTADRKRKDITAYDALYDVINANVADWYNALLPNADSTVTLKQFRDSFFGYFGIEQVEVSLINDSMIVTKTIQPTELSGSMVVNAICELNGCFGHINRDGLMDYVFLKGFEEALYPSDDLFPAEDLYPKSENFHKYYSSDYPSGGCDYQEYVVRKITGLEIRQAEDSVGAFVGERENPYVVSDNFLIYGKSTEEMTTIAQNMFSVIKDIEYRPFTLNTFRGNPCVEVGDGIKIYTDNQIIQSYVLNRTLTGIQAISDVFETNGKEYRAAKVNSVQSQITQLKGKTNRIERTVEETSSKISDLEKNTETEIRQLADSIAITVDEKGNVVTDLTVDANGMTFKGNYLVINTKNLQLDEDGANFSGDVEALSLSARDIIKMYQQNEVGLSTEEVTVMQFISKLVTPNYSQSILLIGGDGSYIVRFVSPTYFNSSAHVAGVMSVGGLLTANGGISGSVEGYDGTLRIPVGSSTLVGERINYIRTLTNDKGVTRVGFNGLYGETTYKTLYATVETSDERLKENIKKTKVIALDRINQIEHDEFDWKASNSHQEIGYVAQKLEKVDKRMVIPPENDDEYYQVNAFYMMGLVTKAIQELSAESKELSQENRELKSEIDELKKSVSILLKKLGGMADE